MKAKKDSSTFVTESENSTQKYFNAEMGRTLQMSTENEE